MLAEVALFDEQRAVQFYYHSGQRYICEST
jgi:hypothetical protein